MIIEDSLLPCHINNSNKNTNQVGSNQAIRVHVALNSNDCQMIRINDNCQIIRMIITVSILSYYL